MGEVITDECRVSPELVHGAYAKSKAAANKKVLLAAEKGLDAGIVYPSGIIGPGDRGMGSMTVMLRSFLRGRLPAGVCGGYETSSMCGTRPPARYPARTAGGPARAIYSPGAMPP